MNRIVTSHYRPIRLVALLFFAFEPVLLHGKLNTWLRRAALPFIAEADYRRPRMTLSRFVILSAMTSGFALSAPAQEVPQSVATGVNATNSTFVQDWNKHDPAAIAGTFTPNALLVAPPGNFVGRQGVQQYYDKVFATVHPASNFTHDIDRVEMLSNDLAIATGHWSLADPPAKGFWSGVYEHQGTAWPMRAHAHNVAPPAPATQTTSKP